MSGLVANLIEMLKNPETRKMIAEVLTQVVAFLAFLWIMKKIAWAPVLQLFDERRKKIAEEYEKVDLLEEKFNKLKSEYETKIAEIDQEARQKLQDAVDEGRKFAREIVENARQEYKERLQKAQQDIEIEMKNAKKEFKDFIINMTIATTEKLLKEKLDEPRHKALVANFISELEKEN